MEEEMFQAKSNEFVRLPMKFFDWGKGFGFATHEGGRDVYLDARMARVPVVEAGQVFYSLPKAGEPLRRINEKGFELVLEVAEGPKGPQASMWGYADEFDRAREELTAASDVVDPAFNSGNLSDVDPTHPIVKRPGRSAKPAKKGKKAAGKKAKK